MRVLLRSPCVLHDHRRHAHQLSGALRSENLFPEAHSHDRAPVHRMVPDRAGVSGPPRGGADGGTHDPLCPEQAPEGGRYPDLLVFPAAVFPLSQHSTLCRGPKGKARQRLRISAVCRAPVQRVHSVPDSDLPSGFRLESFRRRRERLPDPGPRRGVSARKPAGRDRPHRHLSSRRRRASGDDSRHAGTLSGGGRDRAHLQGLYKSARTVLFLCALRPVQPRRTAADGVPRRGGFCGCWRSTAFRSI